MAAVFLNGTVCDNTISYGYGCTGGYGSTIVFIPFCPAKKVKTGPPPRFKIFQIIRKESRLSIGRESIILGDYISECKTA